MLRRTVLPLVTAFSGVFASTSFAATTQWSNASANGNGCPIGTSQVAAAGDEIAWIFDSFFFDLVNPESASRFCRLTATATIANGWYLGQLSQVLSYAGVKSTFGSRLKVGAASRFFGFTLPLIEHNYPNGVPFNSTFMELQGSNMFSVFAPASYWCAGSRPQGLFQSTLSATGQVFPGGGSLSFAGQGFNVKFEAVAGLLQCQP
jgi:hypothetical protein